MTSKDLLRGLGCIEEEIVAQAAVGEPRREKKGACRWRLALAACACLLLAGTALSFQLLLGDSPSQGNEHQPGELAASITPGATPPALAITAYVPLESQGLLTARYQAETQATTLTPGFQLPLARYNPALSSVPGLPFTLQAPGADSLQLFCTAGELLNWDPQTGIVTRNGDDLTCQSGDTVYWSPLGKAYGRDDGPAWTGDGVATVTRIEVVARKNGRELGAQTLYIGAAGEWYYAAVSPAGAG